MAKKQSVSAKVKKVLASTIKFDKQGIRNFRNVDEAIKFFRLTQKESEIVSLFSTNYIQVGKVSVCASCFASEEELRQSLSKALAPELLDAVCVSWVKWSNN
jgi:hypothetical protein